jgi:ABC-type branched-subunit amino acid transport system substrate-binding protein
VQIKLQRRTLIVSAAAVAVSSLAIASLPANAAAEPGISATEIVLGMQLPQTGAASPGYNKVDDAMRAYFDYVNSKGGVNGRKIRLEVKDDQYKAGLTITTASSLINNEKVFAMVGSIGTQTHISVIGDLNRRKIPDIFINSGYSGFYTDPKKYPYSFGGLGTYVVEAKILGKYIKENFADKKVGILYQTDDFGRNAIAGFKTAGVTFETGKTSAGFIAGTQGSVGLASQMSQLKANGVQVVIIASVASTTAVAVSTAAALGYKPDKWVVMSVGADATTFQTILGSKGVPAATSAALLTGIISASHAPAPGEDTDPYVVAFKKINDDFNKGPDKRWDNNILQGMNIAYQTTAALMGVGKDLTRAKLVAYLENNGSKISSGALAPLGYSKTTHEAFTGFWIGAYNASTVLTPITTPRVVYTTDSGTGPVTVSNYVRPAIAADALPKVG